MKSNTIWKEDKRKGDKGTMKNTLADLNNYLFESIERITDDDLSDEQLEKEIRRSDAVQKIAKTIIENGHLALSAKKYVDEQGGEQTVDMPMLGITSGNK
jgi:phage protein